MKRAVVIAANIASCIVFLLLILKQIFLQPDWEMSKVVSCAITVICNLLVLKMLVKRADKPEVADRGGNP